MKKQLQLLCCYALSLFVCIASVHAQQERSSVTGIIRSENGATLSNATVVAQNTKTNYTASTQTDSTGVFYFSGLPSGGGYSFTFSYIGFETQTLGAYSLKPGATFSLIVLLKEQANTLNNVVV